MERPDALSRAAPFRWMGHATVLLPGPPCVVVDPWNWRRDEACADLVLVTHAHVDHCSEEDLRAVRREGAWALGPEGAAPLLREVFGAARVIVLCEGDRHEGGGASVTALPAEGPPRGGRRSGFHPRGEGLTYLVETCGARYLLLGDSAVLPQHRGLAPDVAFIAAAGMVVMEPEEAAEAAASLGAGLAVPVHWGDLHGRYDVAARFLARCAELGVRAAVEPPG